MIESSTTIKTVNCLFILDGSQSDAECCFRKSPVLLRKLFFPKMFIALDLAISLVFLPQCLIAIVFLFLFVLAAFAMVIAPVALVDQVMSFPGLIFICGISGDSNATSPG